MAVMDATGAMQAMEGMDTIDAAEAMEGMDTIDAAEAMEGMDTIDAAEAMEGDEEAAEATVATAEECGPDTLQISGARRFARPVGVEPLKAASGYVGAGSDGRRGMAVFRVLDENDGNEQAIQRMMEDICREFPCYGYRKVKREMARRGLSVNHKKIIRIMRMGHLGPGRVLASGEVLGTGLGKGGGGRMRPDRETVPNYPNLIKGNGPEGPDRVWVSDVTCIGLVMERVYLAAVIDLYSRRCIGWSLGRGYNGGLVMGAVRMAVRERAGAPDGLIHHSDRGLLENCASLGEFLGRNGVRISVNRRGYPYDSPAIERFFRTLKFEHIRVTGYWDYRDALDKIGNFIEEVYNRKRLHEALGYVPPAEFEENSMVRGNRR